MKRWKIAAPTARFSFAARTRVSLILAFALCVSMNPQLSSLLGQGVPLKSTLTVPPGVSAQLKGSGFSARYALYTLPSVVPRDFGDLASFVLLFVSDEIFILPRQGDLSGLPSAAYELALSTLETESASNPLFQSSKCFVRFAGLVGLKPHGEPDAVMDDELKFTLHGKTTPFLQQIFGFTEKTPIDTVLARAAQEMELNEKTVLMVSMSIRSARVGRMRELVLK